MQKTKVKYFMHSIRYLGYMALKPAAHKSYLLSKNSLTAR